MRPMTIDFRLKATDQSRLFCVLSLLLKSVTDYARASCRKDGTANKQEIVESQRQRAGTTESRVDIDCNTSGVGGNDYSIGTELAAIVHDAN